MESVSWPSFDARTTVHYAKAQSKLESENDGEDNDESGDSPKSAESAASARTSASAETEASMKQEASEKADAADSASVGRKEEHKISPEKKLQRIEEKQPEKRILNRKDSPLHC